MRPAFHPESEEKVMLNAAQKDLNERFKGMKVKINAAYSGEYSAAEGWLKSVRNFFNDDSIEMYKLPISISCHVGAGVKAIGLIPQMQ